MPTLQRSGSRMAHGSAPPGANGAPAMDTLPAQRPANPAARVADGAKEIAGDAGTVAQVASAFANPEGFLMGKVAGKMDDKLADLTNSISAILPCFPAATLTSLALGAPHAHVAHPPSGPPPVPPTPLPPTGPVLLGTCLQVLINNKPAARCGDIGLNTTCCGLPPMFEIFTGSSKVFIGGARAARAGIDITMHCKSSAGGDRAAAMSAKIANVAAKVASVAAKISQVAAIAGEATEASDAIAEDDAAMAAAHGLNAAMMAAQMAADAAAMAAAAAVGKDPCVPPTGTPGMILAGSPNVLIGGLPMPSSMAVAQGLMKKLKGLKFRRGGRRPPSQNKDCGDHLRPINLITGACVEEYVDYEEREPLPFLWKRYYDSRWTQRPGPFGWGFRHEYQRELTRTLDGLQYCNQEGDIVLFPAVNEEGQSAALDGLALSCSDVGRYLVREQSQPTMEFYFTSDELRAVLGAMHWANGSLYFAYDPQRRLSTLRYSVGGQTRFHYDGTERIVQVTRTKPDDTNGILLASYTYDRAGCLSEFVDALGGRVTYAYDGARRKTRYTDRRGYAVINEYDEQGRCVREYCEDGLFDGRVEYLPEVVRYDYSSRAEITRVVDGGGTVHEYAYDQWDRLVEVRRHDRVKERYRYDLADNLIEKTDGHGRTLLAFVRVEDIRGREVWQARVDPYGMAHVRLGSSIDMPLRFPGHYYIAEIGLHYNRFRYYSPDLGRYLQSDPLGIQGGINLYAYCSNPLTWVDIDGLAKKHDGQRGPRNNENTEGTAVVPPPAESDRAAESRKRFASFRRIVKPGELRGAPPPEGSGVAGHAQSKHKVDTATQASLLNAPERTFNGINKNGRDVDIYYKDGSTVITEGGQKDSVITAYGKVSGSTPVKAEKWAQDPNYVEVKTKDSNEVIYPTQKTWEDDRWPPTKE